MPHDAKNPPRTKTPNVLSWVFVTAKLLTARVQIARDKNHRLRVTEVKRFGTMPIWKTNA